MTKMFMIVPSARDSSDQHGIYEITLEMTMEKKKNVFSTKTTDANSEMYAGSCT